MPLAKINSDLLEAAKSGNLNDLRAALDQGADLKSRDPTGFTALYLAIQHGHCEVVDELVQTRQCALRDHHGETALHFAAILGQYKMIDHLLANYDLSLDEKNELGLTPLSCVVIEGEKEMLAYLVGKDKQLLSATDNERNNLLHLASAGGFHPIIKYLLDTYPENFPIEARNLYGNTALLKAVILQKSLPETIELLVKHYSANLNANNNEGKTSLHLAVEKDDLDTVRQLCKLGADQNIQNNAGEDALAVARRKQHKKIIVFLEDQLKLHSARSTAKSAQMAEAVERTPSQVVELQTRIDFLEREIKITKHLQKQQDQMIMCLEQLREKQMQRQQDEFFDLAKLLQDKQRNQEVDSQQEIMALKQQMEIYLQEMQEMSRLAQATQQQYVQGLLQDLSKDTRPQEQQKLVNKIEALVDRVTEQEFTLIQQSLILRKLATESAPTGATSSDLDRLLKDNVCAEQFYLILRARLKGVLTSWELLYTEMLERAQTSVNKAFEIGEMIGEQIPIPGVGLVTKLVSMGAQEAVDWRKQAVVKQIATNKEFITADKEKTAQEVSARLTLFIYERGYLSPEPGHEDKAEKIGNARAVSVMNYLKKQMEDGSFFSKPPPDIREGAGEPAEPDILSSRLIQMTFELDEEALAKLFDSTFERANKFIKKVFPKSRESKDDEVDKHASMSIAKGRAAATTTLRELQEEKRQKDDAKIKALEASVAPLVDAKIKIAQLEQQTEKLERQLQKEIEEKKTIERRLMDLSDLRENLQQQYEQIERRLMSQLRVLAGKVELMEQGGTLSKQGGRRFSDPFGRGQSGKRPTVRETFFRPAADLTEEAAGAAFVSPNPK